LFLRILDQLEEFIIATLIAAATLVIFLAVIQRFAVGVPFLYPIFFQLNMSWSQELCIYMFIWMAKFGAAYGVRKGIHVGVDVMINQLDTKWKKIIILFSLCGGVLFTFIVGSMGLKFVMGLYPTEQTSPDLEIPSWIVYSCIPLGSYLMSFRFVQVAIAFYKKGELPQHDPSHVSGVEPDALTQELGVSP
jgi:C4-dicarboxylate transporter DctQ subunit